MKTTPALSRYQIVVEQNDRYGWSAVVVDTSGATPEKPETQRISIMAKSLPELMAKVLISVTLRDTDKANTAAVGLVQPVTKPLVVPHNQ